jgi:hypothetical protein
MKVDTVYMTLDLSNASRDLAGILLLSIVTIELGGAFILRVVQGKEPATDIQKSFFRAGHAHAGVLVLLGLVMQLYVDATDLSGGAEWLGRSGVPAAALLIPGGFFFSVMRRGAAAPSRLIWLIYAGVALLAAGVVTLGIGLLTA